MKDVNPSDRREAGRQPKVGAECRAFLRATLGERGPVGSTRGTHAESCAFCSARLAVRDRLAPLLRVRPAMSTETPSLQGVHERIVEMAESSFPGQAIAKAMPVSSLGSEDGGWPEALLESDVGRRMHEVELPASKAAWSNVRESILVGVATTAARRIRRNWLLGVVGAAVAGVVTFLLVPSGSPEVPSIVFVDLDSAPGVDFAVLRYGATR